MTARVDGSCKPCSAENTFFCCSSRKVRYVEERHRNTCCVQRRTTLTVDPGWLETFRKVNTKLGLGYVQSLLFIWDQEEMFYSSKSVSLLTETN